MQIAAGGSTYFLPEGNQPSNCSPVPVMPHPSIALDVLATAGQAVHKNCPVGRADMGGERMQEENTAGEREFEEQTQKER